MTPRQKIIRETQLMLGFPERNVELHPDHYELALDTALERYRQRTSNSVEERVAFLELQPGQMSYYLPTEVVEVRQIFRRSMSGTTGGTGVNLDPFTTAFINQTIISGGGQTSLLTYELYMGYQELVMRMFGGYINFHWHSSSHRLDIQRDIRSPETVLLWIYNYRTEDSLLSDTYAKPWLRDYTLAKCKIMLGTIRSKFGNYVGPQGGTTLDGDALKAEGEAELQRLEEEAKNGTTENFGYTMIIG